MWVMSAISGLMVGTQYFRAEDTPLLVTPKTMAYHNIFRLTHDTVIARVSGR